ncbi:hypothetical protein D3C79_915020 [compost metagenome]
MAAQPARAHLQCAQGEGLVRQQVGHRPFVATWQLAQVWGQAGAVHQEAQVDHQSGDHHGHRQGGALHQLHHYHLRGP